MVVVKIFTNSPYFLWESFGLSFLDYPTIQFPLSQLCLHWLLLYSLTWVILPKEKEGNE